MNHRINHKRKNLSKDNPKFSMKEVEDLKFILHKQQEVENEHYTQYSNQIKQILKDNKNDFKKMKGEIENIQRSGHKNIITLHNEIKRLDKAQHDNIQLLRDKTNKEHSFNTKQLSTLQDSIHEIKNKISTVELNYIKRDNMWNRRTYSDKNESGSKSDLYLCKEEVDSNASGIWIIRLNWIYTKNNNIYSGTIHMIWKKELKEEPVLYDYEIQYYNEEIEEIVFCVLETNTGYTFGVKVVDTNSKDETFSEYSFKKIQ